MQCRDLHLTWTTNNIVNVGCFFSDTVELFFLKCDVISFDIFLFVLLIQLRTPYCHEHMVQHGVKSLTGVATVTEGGGAEQRLLLMNKSEDSGKS